MTNLLDAIAFAQPGRFAYVATALGVLAPPGGLGGLFANRIHLLNLFEHALPNTRSTYIPNFAPRRCLY